MKKMFWAVSMAAATTFGALVIPSTFADPSTQTPPAMQLPPGWTMDDVMACQVAGTPGEMHARLAADAGTWEGKSSMVMAPGMPAMESTNIMTVTPIMDGRYVQVTSEGDMPGMGSYKGQGIYGYDNVSQQFVAVWFDNMGTGIMNGTGTMSADGKVITTNYSYNCPLTKKPSPMREVSTVTGENTRLLEMYTKDPKSGQEYKMLTIEYTKK